MDLNMITVHGDEATRQVTYFIQIKQLISEHNYKSTIIVGHSGDENDEIKKKIINAGADHNLIKPCGYKQLKEFIEKIIE